MLLPIIWVDLISLFVDKHIDFQLISNAPKIKAHHLATKGTLKKDRKSLIETRPELFSAGKFKKNNNIHEKRKGKYQDEGDMQENNSTKQKKLRYSF